MPQLAVQVGALLDDMVAYRRVAGGAFGRDVALFHRPSFGRIRDIRLLRQAIGEILAEQRDGVVAGEVAQVGTGADEQGVEPGLPGGGGGAGEPRAEGLHVVRRGHWQQGSRARRDRPRGRLCRVAERTLLLDAPSLYFRAFFGIPETITAPDGTPVNAVFGFSQMLSRLLATHAGTHLGVVFDAGRTTFRNEIFPAYKAQRPEPPPELGPQFALVREATAAFGAPGLEVDGWEADDVIASYARAAVEAGGRVTIISSDKDLMQLVGERVVMQDPIKQKLIGPAEVFEKFGVAPDRVVDVQALMGDSVDNVPGVPGIGPKTASQLVAEFGSLDGVLDAADRMKPGRRRDLLLTHAEAARTSRRLVTPPGHGPQAATKTVPAGIPSAGPGPATPVVARPTSAPRTRATPSAICSATSASTGPVSRSRPVSTPSTAALTSVA